MTKRDWYKLGLIFSIVFYLAVFLLAFANYNTKMSTLNIERNFLDKYKIYSSIFEKYGNGNYISKSDFAAISQFKIQRNTILILNPFWMGIIIFAVLLKKTTAKQTVDNLN